MQKLQNTEKILLVLSQVYVKIESLEEKIGIPKKELLVYLTRLYKRGLIYRK